MDYEAVAVKRQSLVTFMDVDFEVVTWAPAQADADLLIACMFEREMPGTHLSGGMLQLDEALGGALTRLREESSFRAQEMETLLIRTVPASVRARSILVIGLGDPLSLSSAILERALRVALREAVRLGASSVSFAPDLIDAGQTDLSSLDVEGAMVRGVLGALHAEHRLAELGRAPFPAIRGWAFETGLAHFQAAKESFLRAFRNWTDLAAH